MPLVLKDSHRKRSRRWVLSVLQMLAMDAICLWDSEAAFVIWMCATFPVGALRPAAGLLKCSS